MDLIGALSSQCDCRVASPHDSVHNSECVYTFHTPYTTPKGILVNLSTFVGTCEDLAPFDGTGDVAESALFLRIVKRRVEKKTEEGKREAKGDGDGDQQQGDVGGGAEGELASGVTKLGVGVEGGFASEADKFETISSYSVVAFDENGRIAAEVPYVESSNLEFPTAVALSADSIINHSGSAVQQDLKAWELDDEPKPVSKYCDDLPFVDNGKMISPDPKDWKCEKSGDTDNLWLNLSDGFIGGGRKNWDGSGGSNGALDHFEETGGKYPLVVKLGTITLDADTADCYSYAKDEDGPVKIPNLADLLAKRGIKVAGMKKTAKSTAELEVELNATYAFDAITEAGAHLVPVSGPGLQGLQNLGNSCYMNTVLQLLLSGTVPELASRYGVPAGGDVTGSALLRVPPEDASDDILCQAAKVASALTSGAFAGPVPESAVVTDDSSPADSASTDPKYRLAPRMFKHAVASDHPEYATGQQQDSALFLQYLLEKLDRAELGARGTRIVLRSSAAGDDGNASSGDFLPASWLFSYGTKSRMECAADGAVRYLDGDPENMLSLRIPMEEAGSDDGGGGGNADGSPEVKRQKSEEAPEGDATAAATATATAGAKEEKEVPTVSLRACLDAWAAPSTVQDKRWPHLNNERHPAKVTSRMANFPRYLIVQMQRYEMGADWLPKKLEVNIDVPEQVDLGFLRSTGPKEGEFVVTDEEEEGKGEKESDAAAAAGPTIDAGAVTQLMDMGFSENGCKRALMTVGGSDVESAMNWIFEHNMDPDFNDPLPEVEASGGEPAPTGSGSGVDEGAVASLVESLGCFTADQVRAALRATEGALDRAADWLFSHMDDLDGAIAALDSKQQDVSSLPPPSKAPLDDGEGKYTLVGMISHIGKNTGSGHYVCHLKKDGKWVIFNDEKVALSEAPPKQHAYVYLFQRDDTIGSPNARY